MPAGYRGCHDNQDVTVQRKAHVAAVRTHRQRNTTDHQNRKDDRTAARMHQKCKSKAKHTRINEMTMPSSAVHTHESHPSFKDAALATPTSFPLTVQSLCYNILSFCTSCHGTGHTKPEMAAMPQHASVCIAPRMLRSPQQTYCAPCACQNTNQGKYEYARACAYECARANACASVPAGPCPCLMG